ncbi:suppressor of IKBKE 1 isoform X2 [Peromyscus maniculatus bairdii]|uniref:suppressor of IKBKE 1 isoform X2 n=1 Tax=Peromyscus leucopus TaxID=10041 RepID=UPI00188574D5|nr:suppressor of IKBKE 1 isoform X2 [Peromyscus leucopus]XP_042135558.1 suppressor of IKBKE 1 isoform X2 [Peromyscus maniculatus bairdii]
MRRPSRWWTSRPRCTGGWRRCGRRAPCCPSRSGRAGPRPGYQEDAPDVKDMSKYKPHILLSQENTQIRDLQQENRELWVSLEEHQDALELIMSKYRKQMLQLMVAKKAVDTEPVLKAHQSHSAEIESQIDRICEMGEVMRKAVQVDDNQFCKIQEKLAQLELENKELRELLSISSESLQVEKENSVDPASQPIK